MMIVWILCLLSIKTTGCLLFYLAIEFFSNRSTILMYFFGVSKACGMYLSKLRFISLKRTSVDCSSQLILFLFTFALHQTTPIVGMSEFGEQFV